MSCTNLFVKRDFMFVFIKFWIHFRASTSLFHQPFYPRKYFTNLKVENVETTFYFHKTIFTGT